MQAACKKEIFFYFDAAVNRDTLEPNAKSANSRIRRRSFELASGWKSEKNLIYAWILLMILSIILTLIIQDWAYDIDPAGSGMNVGLSVTRIDRDRLEVMILSIERDTNIDYLAYYTSRGTGYINRSVDTLAPVRDAGDIGIIPVSGYNEKVEIFAAIRDEKIRIYSKTE